MPSAWLAPASLLLCASSALAAQIDAAANTEWLELNAQSEKVVVLSSGLQYEVIAAGPADGPRPGPSDSCTCHYEGSLIDGTVFDSSRKRGKPATFSPSGVITGWTEALQLMRPGDRWKLFIPAPLGYGARGAGGKIPGGATLIFDLELIGVAESKGLFSGTFLDADVGPFFKLWHVGLAIIAYLAYRLVSGAGGGGKTVSASHILVKDEDECNTLKAELAKKETSFAALAAKHSTCPSSSKGGALGTFGPGQMVPAFDQVCWSAPIGEVQGPVQTQFGYHLILVTARSDGEEKKE